VATFSSGNNRISSDSDRTSWRQQPDTDPWGPGAHSHPPFLLGALASTEWAGSFSTKLKVRLTRGPRHVAASKELVSKKPWQLADFASERNTADR
jgi:hypothetical protein